MLNPKIDSVAIVDLTDFPYLKVTISPPFPEKELSYCFPKTSIIDVTGVNTLIVKSGENTEEDVETAIKSFYEIKEERGQRGAGH